MEIHFSNPKNVHEVTGYSHAGYFDTPARVVYVSGQIARNEKGEIVGAGNMEVQTRQVFKNISNILASMGGNLRNVVKINIYTTKVDQLPTIRKLRDEFFPGSEKPCSTLVGVTGLALPEYLIEIGAVAALDPE